MRGSVNLGTGYITTNIFSPDTANDLIANAVAADDEALYPLIGLEPPAAASATVVNVGYLPLRRGSLVVPGSGRNIVVRPVRLLRSATSVSTPRAMVSATVDVDTTLAMPAAPGTASTWGWELLYAELALVDALAPTKGITVTLKWASPTYASTSGAATFGALPANTSSKWNVPLRYVRNVYGQTQPVQADIIEVPPAVVSGFAGNIGAKLNARVTGVEHRPAYSSANHAPATLQTGGASAFASGNQILSSTDTPAVLGATECDVVNVRIALPKEKTGVTNGIDRIIVVDDKRDWRNGEFFARAIVGLTSTLEFASGTAGGASRTFPLVHRTSYIQSTTSYMYMLNGAILECAGQSFVAQSLTAANLPILATSRRWVAAFDVLGATASFTGGLYADETTGYLTFITNRAGAVANGPPVLIHLTGWFPQ